MKRITGILALLLGLSMLTACGGQTQADDPPPATPLNTAGTEDGTAGPDIPTSSSMVCRIVDGAGERTASAGRPGRKQLRQRVLA